LPRRRRDFQSLHRGAQARLRKFRQGTALAVALTAMLLLLGGVPEITAQETGQTAANAPVHVNTDPGAALEEATTTVRDLFGGLYGLLPKIGIALLFLLAAWGLSRLVRVVAPRVFGRWERGEAVAALAQIVLFLAAIAAGLSVISGDAAALVGSVGLVGLALSWALQTPIESFTGWVLNALRGYYRKGDRIEVGDVFGDVYRIDILTTTVWEAGGPGRAITAAQPTGSLITFPNWEVLRSNVINYSRDFPFVWDEVAFGVTNESDLRYAVEVLQKLARKLFGETMKSRAEQYRALLKDEGLDYDISDQPQVYLSQADSWTDCTIRYLVPVRERRRWSSELVLVASEELAREEHRGRIVSAYPRTDIALIPTEPAPGP
jgi:small-conductance mechanosensitive channel